MKINPSIASVIVLLLVSSFASAQTSTVSGETLPLDSCIAIAVKNNLSLQASYLNVQKNQKLQKTSFDINNTQLFYENEDLNKSVPNDDGILKIGISQTLEFPTVYTSQSKINKQNTTIAKTSFSLAEKEITRDVKSAYFNLSYAVEKQKLLSKQDSIFSDYENAAELRHKTGETSKLELISAQARRKEMQIALQEASADVMMAQQELMKLLNTTRLILPSASMQKLEMDIPNKEAPPNHPYTSVFQQKILLADYNQKAAVSQLFPDVNLRYFNQDMLGISPGYYGYSVGISIPIFFWSQSGKIQAAKLQKQIAEKDYQASVLELNTAYSQASLELQKNLSLFNYYETTGLKQADEILSASTQAYKAGEIGYVEYTSLVSQGIGIRNSYLSALNNYNQSVITIQYFINK